MTVCPTDLFSKRYSAATNAAALGSDLSREPLGVFQRKGELNSALQTYMNDVLAARREKDWKEPLRSGIFSSTSACLLLILILTN